MELVLDTNVLVYDTLEDSENHEKAKRIIDEAEIFCIPSVVAHEFVWVLLKKLNLDAEFIRKKVSEYLVEDPRAKYTLESPQVIGRALRKLSEDKKSPTLANDYIILETATDLGLALATFDEELKRIALKHNVKTIP
ncbi:MAG: PIN domain-containing protein [Thermoproteota archaeon]